MEAGDLYVIATPIGNLEDITLRALRVLREEIHVVYCEDTRQTRKLMQHYGIDIPAYSIHAHTSSSKIQRAIQEISSGRNAAYMTDSGTPGVSDPGAALVEAARSEGIRVIPLPGPSALSAIVSVSGFTGKEVVFGGFLSKKEGKRRKELQKFREFDGIIVVYESPYRVSKLLTAIHEVFPGADMVIGRELTKIYEEVISGKVSDIMNSIDSITMKGEFVIAINNRSK